ncbi:hypothetical protein PsYK624_147760 [Phanerochaete sordida]|uniref:RING-type domain-containing protein n=1 Tax=Phanerochaete sordida TaxID=48140 RepID=A0A9P3LLC3_9APHY|nr:hypothetical protein PsYK624_147760 [Phanerochaete sordida]
MSGATCSICLEDAQSPVVVPCGHIHCETCLVKCIETCQDAVECPCPTCRAPFTIAIPDLRFVPQKYHAFMQPAVRRVYPSQSELVQTLEERNSKLQTDNARLREKYDALKRKNEHLQRDKARLMENCEANQAAVANYREKERQLRDDLDAATEETDARELEAAEWEKKYRDTREKYTRLKKQLAEEKHASPASHARKRNSTQAALELSPGEGPARHASTGDRRPIAPIPKRIRLTGTRPSAPIDVDPQERASSARVREWASTSAAGVGAAYVGRRPPALRSGLTTLLAEMDASPDVSQELDAEERDGPSKARARRSLGDSPSSSQASASYATAPGSAVHASVARAGPSRLERFAPIPVPYRQARRPPRAPVRAPELDDDVFASEDGSQGNLDFSLGSSPAAFPPLEVNGRARLMVHRGKRVLQPLTEF